MYLHHEGITEDIDINVFPQTNQYISSKTNKQTNKKIKQQIQKNQPCNTQLLPLQNNNNKNKENKKRSILKYIS